MSGHGRSKDTRPRGGARPRDEQPLCRARKSLSCACEVHVLRKSLGSSAVFSHGRPQQWLFQRVLGARSKSVGRAPKNSARSLSNGLRFSGGDRREELSGRTDQKGSTDRQNMAGDRRGQRLREGDHASRRGRRRHRRRDSTPHHGAGRPRRRPPRPGRRRPARRDRHRRHRGDGLRRGRPARPDRHPGQQRGARSRRSRRGDHRRRAACPVRRARLRPRRAQPHRTAAHARPALRRDSAAQQHGRSDVLPRPRGVQREKFALEGMSEALVDSRPTGSSAGGGARYVQDRTLPRQKHERGDRPLRGDRRTDPAHDRVERRHGARRSGQGRRRDPHRAERRTHPAPASARGETPSTPSSAMRTACARRSAPGRRSHGPPISTRERPALGALHTADGGRGRRA